MAADLEAEAVLRDALGTARLFLLRLDADIATFFGDHALDRLSVAGTTGFHRMLVHKAAGMFGLDHTGENTNTGRMVVLTKVPGAAYNSRLSTLLASAAVEPAEAPRALKLMRRDTTSENNRHAPASQSGAAVVTSTVPAVEPPQDQQDREEQYKRARDRIFQGMPTPTDPPTSATIFASMGPAVPVPEPLLPPQHADFFRVHYRPPIMQSYFSPHVGHFLPQVSIAFVAEGLTQARGS